MNILRLSEPEFSHLSRFLAAPENRGHAFGAIQKPFVAINSETHALAMPVSLDSVAIAGSIEDRATHSQLAVSHMQQILDNLYLLSSFQLLHAAQAVDLREGFTLGEQTRALHQAYRQVVPFVEQDRPFTPDIRQGAVFLESWTGAGGTDEDGGRAPAGGAAAGAGGMAQGAVVWMAVLGGIIAAAGMSLLILRDRSSG